MITFGAPLLLLGLLAIPVLWILLRAIPPAPVIRKFPAVTLLLGLREDQVEADKTPWWLLLLRALAIGAVIVGFSGPVWQNTPQSVTDKPLLVVVDAGWATASDWTERRAKAEEVIDAAGRSGRSVAILNLTRPTLPIFGAAGIAARDVGGLTPDGWLPDGSTVLDVMSDIEGDYDTYWLAGPLAFDGQKDLIPVFETAGNVTVFETGRDVLALRPPELTGEGVTVTVTRSGAATVPAVQVQAMGLDPTGQQRVLDMASARFDSDAQDTTVVFQLPAELRDRVTRFQIQGLRSAGAVTLSDDGLKRREIALISTASEDQEGLVLLSQLHFLRQALVPSSDLVDGTIAELLQANPDTLILADVPNIPNSGQVLDWVEQGGLLIRFAGPRLAAATFDATAEDPLLPVRLRAGGRSIGGAMSWGAPKTLQDFPNDSPFFGLIPPDEVTVTSQVLAEPGPDLAQRAIARLEDGTPLVTRKPHGQGAIVLFHVTANADWSSLPLSGLFMSMLDRLSVATGQQPTDAADLDGTIWSQVAELDGFGNVFASSERAGIDGQDLVSPLSSDLPPGKYQSDDRIFARNAVTADLPLMRPIWPDRVTVEGPSGPSSVDLKPWLLLAAMVLFAADMLAALAISGKLRGGAVAVVLTCFAFPHMADAQDEKALLAANEVVLAYVVTGDARQDDISRAGLQGLSNTLFFRTAVEPAPPVGLDLAVDELSLYPFIYWPITLNQSPPSFETVVRLNRYLRAGGMILFDTRDGNLSGYGAGTAEARKLQELAQGLEIPPLAPIPDDHVLTRTFYLLQDFPGRHLGPTIWVEATPPSDLEDGQAFRNLNDGVTPVVIGGNDWAAAWATTPEGRPMLPVGRGFAGDRQREIARRFGVNLIMHVLTGNYKSDQVHVPDLLDRLGQ